MSTTWFIVAVWLFVGIGQLVVGIRMTRDARRRRAIVTRCRPARAVVTSVGTETMMMNTATYGVQLPVVSVRYLDGQSTVRDSTLAIKRSWERYTAGQEIDVLYDPENPDTVLTRGNDTMLDLAGPFFTALGSLLTVLALVFLYVVLRWF